jgi:hypothetical protein
MAKKLEDMTRKELLEMYEARGGKLSDFNKRYVNRRDLLGALQELDDVLESSASFEGPFEFVEEDEVEEAPVVQDVDKSAHSDQWYIARGLPIPRR